MNKSDRQRIKAAVLTALREYKKPLCLPLPIKAIVKQFNNVRLVSYSKQMARRGLSYEDMLAFAGTEDACTDYDADLDLYIIYYNDCDKKIMYTNRYRWNIAHELGHIMLSHHKNHTDSRLFRSRLSEHTYRGLEAEADMFAAYILVPHIVLNCLELKEDYEIAETCKVSDTASLYRASDIKIWMKRGKSTEYDFSVLNIFSKYIECHYTNDKVGEWLLEHRICSICHNPLPDFSHDFCLICGNSNEFPYKVRRDSVRYLGIEIDEDGRAYECPVCHNTDLYEHGTVCIICGHEIINYCCDADNSDPFTPKCSHREPLPGYARYCPYCGSKTTFYERGYLSPWNGEADDTGDELPY